MWKKIALGVGSTVMSGALGMLILSAMGRSESAFDFIRAVSIGMPEAFDNDDRLGWRTKPNIRWEYHGATYTTGADGLRVRPDTEEKALLFLGCSFTWGANVADDETFSWLLDQRLEGVSVINSGCPAYGTTQAYLIAQERLEKGERFERIVYFWFDHHVLRNTLNDEWQGYGNRWFPSLDDDLQPHVDRHKQRERRYYLQTTDREKHTLRIVRGLVDLCARHEQPLTIVRLPCPDFSDRGTTFPILWPQIENLCTTLDLSDTPGGWTDYHPDPTMHRNLAERLATEL